MRQTPTGRKHRHARALDRALFQRLLSGQWLREKQISLLTGPSGVGKAWLACALAHQACRQGYSTYYVGLPRLLGALRIGRADGRYSKLLKQLVKVDVLALDECGSPRSTTCIAATCWRWTTTTMRARPL